MAALLGFEKSTTSEAITVSRWEIIITEQINKFFDAATSLPSVSTFTLGPQKQGLRVGSGVIAGFNLRLETFRNLRYRGNVSYSELSRDGTMTTLQTAHPPSTFPSLRTGAEYLRSLNDGRQVFVDGERVADVTKHPAFREAARSVARLYDIAAAPEMRDRMTFPSPKTGGPVLRAFQIPRNHVDLRARRLFSETWAEATFGLMGRSPDHVASFFTGYAAVPNVFAVGGQNLADNVVAFYEFIRDNHLYLSYAIVPPQIDRSKPAHKQSDPTLYAGVVKERDGGIVISGAQQVATLSPVHSRRRRSFGLDSFELHSPIAARRRELRQLPRHPGQRAGRQAHSTPAVRAAR